MADAYKQERLNQETKTFLLNVLLWLTDSVEQLSTAAVLQEEVNSRSFLTVTKEAHDVVIFDHLRNSTSAHTGSIKQCTRLTFPFKRWLKNLSFQLILQHRNSRIPNKRLTPAPKCVMIAPKDSQSNIYKLQTPVIFSVSTNLLLWFLLEFITNVSSLYFSQCEVPQLIILSYLTYMVFIPFAPMEHHFERAKVSICILICRFTFSLPGTTLALTNFSQQMTSSVQFTILIHFFLCITPPPSLSLFFVFLTNSHLLATE